MTSFTWTTGGEFFYIPPYEKGVGLYNRLRGFQPFSYVVDYYYRFPAGMTPNSYTFSGDPVKGTGFLDGRGDDYSLLPGPRLLLCGSGPFTMALGG